ncbi:MAG: DUF4286 family protein [Prevotellaceae bacterium]|jgi:hypothetical protein|nr:DUF4286 family protein [Prevotellaceae bacterium]
MIIFNTTYLVSDKVYGSFVKWIKEKHLPQMLETGHFNSPVVSRVLNNEAPEGSSVSVQFTTNDMDTLACWREQYGDLYEMEIGSLFSEEVLYFSTCMEII